MGLPVSFVKAVENDPYTSISEGQSSDYTITGLLKPARATEIVKQCNVTEDAADLLSALQGQIIHSLIERAKPELEAMGCLVERRFYKTYNIAGKEFVVSTQIDIFDTKKKELSDYKYTSVKAAQRGLKLEHQMQVNFQAMLLREAGYTVDTSTITILMRDWSAERVYESYPVSPCMIQPVPSLTNVEINSFIIGRILDHEAAKIELPLCTPEERWNRPTFAVIRPKIAKAVRVLDSKEAALAYITQKGLSDASVVERPGQSRYCMRYCPARFNCEQWNKERFE